MILLVICCGYSIGQSEYQDSAKYEVVKHDGTKFIGYILSDDGREILLFTDNLGKVYITKSDIKSIRKIDSKADYIGGKYIGAGILTTRYQFTTNAFPIKQGEHYAALNLYGPEVHLSVSDNLSVGVMTTWLASPFVLALKYTVKTGNEKLNFGLGTLLGSSMFLNRASGFGGLHWAMATYGDRRNNVTLSAGYGYFNYNFFGRAGFVPEGTYAPSNVPQANRLGFKNAYNSPLIGLGMMFALNDRVSFIFDAMYIHATRNLYGQNSTWNSDNDQLVSYTYFKPELIRSSVSSLTVIMPGMRFQSKPNRAFQVTLSGVIVKIKSEGYNSWGGSYTNEESFSLPFPNCTWFFNF